MHYALTSPIVFRSNFHDKYRMIMVKEIKTQKYLTEIQCKAFLIKEMESTRNCINIIEKFTLENKNYSKNIQDIVKFSLLFEMDGSLGIYCFGTLPKYISKGIT